MLEEAIRRSIATHVVLPIADRQLRLEEFPPESGVPTRIGATALVVGLTLYFAGDTLGAFRSHDWKRAAVGVVMSVSFALVTARLIALALATV